MHSLPTVMDPRFEVVLRERCLATLDRLPAADETPSLERVTDLLTRASALLELVIVMTATAEFVDELGLRTFGEVRQHAAKIQSHVASATHLEVDAALRLGAELGTGRREPLSDEDPVRVALPRLVRLVRTVLAPGPEDVFKDLAAEFAVPELAYRIDVACEALRSFLRRHDPAQRKTVMTVGRLYQRGAIGLDDVSKLLGESPTDAIAQLEEQGFGRSIETILLSEEERAAHLERIRQDRLNRSGKPAYSRDLVRRSAVASERIEGIDARPWLSPEPGRDGDR